MGRIVDEWIGKMEQWNIGILTYQVSKACGQQNLSGLTKLKIENQLKDP
jgi:uncharacterized protein YidB (DUF937 family)